MRTVSLDEARSTLSRLLQEVERGETVLITRNGRPIAELTAVAKPTLAVGISAVRAQHSVKLAGVSVRELIDEGRR
jgi:prevent-host-death family protein